MRFGVSIKTTVLITALVCAVAWLSPRQLVSTSKTIVLNHEIVDLADEAKLRGWELLDQINALREDMLRLGASPELRKLWQSSAAGDELADTFTTTCRELCGQRKNYLQFAVLDVRGPDDFRPLVASPIREPQLANGELQSGVAFRRFLDDLTHPVSSDATPIFISDLQRIDVARTAGEEAGEAPHVLWAGVKLDRGDSADGAGGNRVLTVAMRLDVSTLLQSERHLSFLVNERGEFLLHPEARQPGMSDRAVDREELFLERDVLKKGFDDLEKEKNALKKEESERLIKQGEPAGTEAEKTADRPGSGGYQGPRIVSGYTPKETIELAHHYFFFKSRPLGNLPLQPRLAANLDLKDLSKAYEGTSKRVGSLYSSDNYVQVRGGSLKEVAELQEVVKKVVKDNTGADLIWPARPVECKSCNIHFLRLPIESALDTRQWGLAHAVCREELAADVDEEMQALTWQAGLLAIIAGVVAFVGSLIFVRPLLRIAAAAESVAQADFTAQATNDGWRAEILSIAATLPVNKRDEIGMLAKAFQNMIMEVLKGHQRLRDANADLDRRVKERTTELEQANTELKAARDKAQELTSAKDAFLASVSHELRNPLNQVSGFCQLLELTDLDDEQRADLQKISGAGGQLLMLINDILDYQKIVMGGITLELEDVTVSELLDEIRDAMELPARDNNSQLVIHCDPQVGTLYADKQRVRQVLLNLVGNACKFTENGTVSISAERVHDNGHESIVFEVADTGRGMTREEQAKLFTPFTKLAARQGNRTGTGLGLVISKGFCEMMHGQIGLQSEYGKGSTFTVRLPADTTVRPTGLAESTSDTVSVKPKGSVRHVAASAERVAEAAASAAKGGPAAHRETAAVPGTIDAARTVLVIDDDAAVREVMTRYLEGRGFHVVTAASGLEGLENAERLRPAVITLDAIMPGLDGWGVLAALKANRQTTDIPVIMVTITDDEERSYSLGAAEFLTKPVDWERLTDVLARYTGNKRDRSILVVEDETEAREILRRNLERDGWRVLEAAHGKAALALLATEQPAAILLDLMMPVMDGFEFLAHYCQLAEWLSIPVIVVTAKDPTPEELSRLDGLVVRVLRKGQYTQDELFKEIHRRVDQHIRA